MRRHASVDAAGRLERAVRAARMPAHDPGPKPALLSDTERGERLNRRSTAVRGTLV